MTEQLLQYLIVLTHDKVKYNRELKLNDYDSAIQTYWSIVKGLEGEVGDFTASLSSSDKTYFLFTKSIK